MEIAQYERIHLIGIGGIGVSGVARILHARGFDVTGSDIRESQITEALREEGVDVTIGHEADNVAGADMVVRSTAIPDDNLELEAAREREIPVVHRSKVLQALLEDYRVVGVTGTHGKGTIASMLAWILECAGWDPGFVIGGLLEDFGTNARDAGGDWFVVEIDESDGTHHNIRPDMVVCNFLELDHLNYYDGLEAIIDSMAEYLEDNERLKETFLNLDCKGNRQLAERVDLRPTGYSTDHRTEFRADLQERSQFPIRFDVFRRDEMLETFELDLPGLYNVVNATGAVAVASRLGVATETMREALASYSGVENRFTISGGGGVTIVKDYVSHPTGIRKVLESARDLVDGRLVSVFKPYRYTLIDYLDEEYGDAFSEADRAVITEMYAADEDPIPGVDSELVVQRIRENGTEVEWVPDEDEITERLHEIVEPGDAVIFFGGDDFFEMAEGFEAELASRAERAEPSPDQPHVDGPLVD